MTRWLLVAVCVLMLAGPAHAYHASPGHWPTTTVQVNGGSCGWAKPECRWLRIVDRTGFAAGSTWRTTTLPNALAALNAAAGYRFNWTTVYGARFNMWTLDPGQPSPCPGPCQGTDHTDEAKALLPLGAVMIGRNGGFAATDYCGNPSLGSGGWPQPYCGADPGDPWLYHAAKSAIAIDANGTSQAALSMTFRHEMGHVLGLGHRFEGDRSIMVGDSVWSVFDAHDKAELNVKYGHVP